MFLFTRTLLTQSRYRWNLKCWASNQTHISMGSHALTCPATCLSDLFSPHIHLQGHLPTHVQTLHLQTFL